MLRSSLRCLTSLPFVPMALSTLDTLEQRMEAAQLTAGVPATTTAAANTKTTRAAVKALTSQHSPPALTGENTRAGQLHWFSADNALPFFVSPKHDGVRLLSYVPPSSPRACTSARATTRAAPAKTRKRSTAADTAKSCSAEEAPVMSCYSRYGRPIYGLFWIEEELQLLRALCGDAHLIVDGELYIHQTDMDAPPLPDAASPPATKTKRAGAAATIKQRARKVPLSAAHVAAPAPPHTAGGGTSSETFKTGFLAVSALVHRLRGSRSQCATEAEVLQYVPALPHVCVFDVPSYSPSPHAVADLAFASPWHWSQHTATPLPRSVTAKAHRAVVAELHRVRQEVLQSLRVRDVEQLRVVPNLTPFSQRLRTMSFLFELLEKGMASPLLRECYCPSQRHHAHKAAGPSTPTSQSRPFAYHGGRFVRRIPYQLATSLDETTQQLLPLYLQHGYEGAVIRTPANPYDLKEKRKGTLAALVAPLLHADASLARSSGGKKCKQRGARVGADLRSRRDRAALLTSLSQSAAATPAWMVRAYSQDTPSVEPLQYVDSVAETLTPAERDAVDAVAVGERALQRARQLPNRSETAVKVLAYQDREYAILRPLLKEPSQNPNTRVLVSIPRSAVSALGYPIKPDSDTVGEGGGRSSDVVVFYGLQCLAENGLVFNVSMPKLTLTQQKALLDHLLAAGRRSASAAPRAKGKETSLSSASARNGKTRAKEQRMASLTGLYATVKFSTLTEHGLPRFGTVKAIRGGKGWFM